MFGASRVGFLYEQGFTSRKTHVSCLVFILTPKLLLFWNKIFVYLIYSKARSLRRVDYLPLVAYWPQILVNYLVYYSIL